MIVNHCKPEDHAPGIASMEYVDCKDGETLWRCRRCGETIGDYHDAGCGGQIRFELLVLIMAVSWFFATMALLCWVANI